MEFDINELYENGISKENVFINEPMKKHTSFKIGGPAEVFIKAVSVEEIKATINIATKYHVPLHIIGNGSNLLVNDEGVKGIVLKPNLTGIKIEKNEDILVKVQSGTTLASLAQKLAQEEISGLEELSGIPGTIGGAIRMNAGAHGKEMKDIVVETKFLDMQGNVHKVDNKQHEFEYRNSVFAKNKYIILETVLKLAKGNKSKIYEKMQEYASWRKANQPLEYPNAGSTFKRGTDFITAQLIDNCGLKGYKIGGAQVSEKHAGFIINTGDATAKDVIELIKYVKEKVYERFGKTIELEIEII